MNSVGTAQQGCFIWSDICEKMIEFFEDVYILFKLENEN